jgi:propanediol dehydratase small subunit
MTPRNESMHEMVRAQVAANRVMVETLMASAQRLEEIGARAMRAGVAQSFDLAAELAANGRGKAAPSARSAEQVFEPYREAAEVILAMNNDLARQFGDYCSQCARTMAGSIGQANDSFGGNGAPMESMFKLWNDAFKQIGDVARAMTANGAPAAAPSAPRKR